MSSLNQKKCNTVICWKIIYYNYQIAGVSVLYLINVSDFFEWPHSYSTTNIMMRMGDCS